MSRYFTLQEANQAMTLIRPLMDEIQNIRQDDPGSPTGSLAGSGAGSGQWW